MSIQNTLSLFLAIFFSISSFANSPTNTESVSYVTSSLESNIGWTFMDYNFGDIVVEEDAETTFKFINLGEEPIIIKGFKSACGCAVMDYQKTPIMPGETSEIKTTFDAKFTGYFSKVVSVYTNQKGAEKQTLRLTGTVVDKTLPKYSEVGNY